MESMTPNNEAAQCVALGYDFEEVFADVRNEVAMLNRQREHAGREQHRAVIWDDEVERRLLHGTWRRVNNELQSRLSGWITEAEVGPERADFKLNMDCRQHTWLAKSLELQFKRAVRAAFVEETLRAADPTRGAGIGAEGHIHELVCTLALCHQ